MRQVQIEARIVEVELEATRQGAADARLDAALTADERDRASR